jgi:xanthine dehydrogenase YagT iron-sulfur-binding subunit
MPIIINGSPAETPRDPRVSVLDLLREHLALSGTKKGCNQGACGACTVLVDGERVLACLALAVQYEGRSITTVEGLSRDGALHPLQQGFIDHDGFQCGYCTPGQLCSAIGMLNELKRGLPSHVTDDLIRFSPLQPRRSPDVPCGSCFHGRAFIGLLAAARSQSSELRSAPRQTADLTR